MQLLVRTAVALAIIFWAGSAFAQLGEVQKTSSGGIAVAISGDWGASNSRLYQHHSGVWRLRQSVSGFRRANAMDGDRVVMGNNLDDPNGITDAGSATIHRYNPQTGQWEFEQKIFASDAAVNDQFGSALAMEGGTIAVSAVGRGDPSHGGVYIFELINGQWEEQQFILPENPEFQDRGFGTAIAIDGDRMVVGASSWSDDTGRAFVFEQDENGVWQQTAMLSGASWTGQLFGSAVDLLGDLIVVGAPWAYEEEERGDFRVFRFDGATWNVEWRWYEVQPAILEGVGISVAIADAGDVIYVGAREAEFFKGGVGDGSIRIFLYDPNEEEWFETDLFRPTDQIPGTEQAFASHIVVNGDWLVAGAPGDNGGGGAVYFYDLTGQLGTRSKLTDATVQFGTLIAGGLSTLKESEDSRVRIRSSFGFTANEPNLADLRIGAHNNVANADVINLLIEARMNQPGGTMKVRLRNWNTNTFNQVHQYSMSPLETVEPVSDIPAANYVHASDNRIELSLRSSALVTFTASGFEAQHDFVNVLVQD